MFERYAPADSPLYAIQREAPGYEAQAMVATGACRAVGVETMILLSLRFLHRPRLRYEVMRGCGFGYREGIRFAAVGVASKATFSGGAVEVLISPEISPPSATLILA